MQLPFPVDEAWQVVHGVDQVRGHHLSYAAFCWDFILAGRPPEESKGQPLHAVADGQVIYVEEAHPLGGREANHIIIKQAEGEYGGYLHIFPQSYSKTLAKPLSRPPQELTKKPNGPSRPAFCGCWGHRYPRRFPLTLRRQQLSRHAPKSSAVCYHPYELH